MPKRPIRAADIYEIRQPSTCRLSPDGKRVVTVASQPDREQLKNVSHLWMVDVESGRSWQFTFGKASDSNPRWSKDGREIAFTSSRSGKSELWIIPADGGEARQVTKLGGSVGDFDWHPSGKSLAIAFTAQDPAAKKREEGKKRGEPGCDSPTVLEVSRLFYKLDGAGFLPEARTHLWLVDAAGKSKPKQLTRDKRYHDGEPRFSPDGKTLYFTSNRSEDPDRKMDRIDIWRMPARGGKITKVRTFDGPSSNISLSPDGRWIAFTGSPDPDAAWNSRHSKLYVVSSTGGRPVELTPALDRSCENSTISDTFGIPATRPAAWSPDGRRLAFVVASEGSAEVWEATPADRKIRPILAEAGAVIDYDVDWTNRRIHATWADTSNPGEVATFPFPGAPGERRVHTTFNAWLKNREVAQPRELWCSSTGRCKVQGWILTPPGLKPGRRCPAMLYIHGGPATQYARVYFHEFQVLAARGYAVLYSNPRASSGYSEKHLSACIGKWGTLDYDDLMNFTDAALKAEPRIDPKRLAVGGGSYGGFMTNWIIGHTQRFKAAVTSRSISNFLSFVGSSDFGYAWPKGFFGHESAWANPGHYLKMSPLTYLKNMKTPTLIEHQEEDHRCPMEQAEQLWAALKYKGVPVEFVRYPQEPHGMSRGGRPDRRIDRMERIVRWLDRWVGSGNGKAGKAGARS